MSKEESNFFDRKEFKADPKLPEHGEYDTKNFDNDMNSCGITDIESFQKRHIELFSNLVVDSNEQNPVATVCKKIETAFSKREIAFLMSKDLLTAAYKQSLESLKQDKDGK
jgi:hypothetical protein